MMENKKKYLDYEGIKSAVSVYDVLTEHYGLKKSLVERRKGLAYSGPCPICKSKQGSPFRVINDGEVSFYYCAAECNSAGNVLEFVAKMEDTDIHEAAFLLHEWFDLKSPATNGEKKTTTEGTGYLRDVEKELRALLSAGANDATIRFVKEKVLESYRNGQAVKKQPA